MMNRFLATEKAATLLRNLQDSPARLLYDPAKHRLTVHDESGNEQFAFRLPLLLPYPFQESDQVNYVILLVQSGNCAIGYFENGVNLDHKVFRSYMVRKKQGKSQLKYLKTKGKSRAGSRVRLGETIEFFENVNERLQTYFEQYEIHRIAISCSKTLIPYLYNSKIETPFEKSDPRIYKIPKHIHTPIYEVMLDANRFLQRGELIYEVQQQPLIEKWVSAADLEDAAAKEDVADEEDLDW
ncbi:hypothetical protein ACXYMU_10700 [Pontibacter sp. CAU 1760]